jgi:fatty acid desaturase
MLGPARAVLFVLIHHALAGLYLGWVFAPNHIGMRILEADSRMDFLRRQVLTTRNVRPHPLIDFWYGGLNYQIEHHLFPNMPRNQLRRARDLVKGFCAAQGIPYYETGVFRSCSDVLKNLHEVSAQLRVR